jgi:c-di-GMP-binding flagellar brake protein YcgR
MIENQTKPKEKERRKSPRILVKVNLQLWEDEKTEKTERRTKGFVKNISLDGMSIVTDVHYPVDSDLVLSLALPDDLKMNIYGKIVWMREIEDLYRYGIKFTELDLREKPKLYRFILVTLYMNDRA